MPASLRWVRARLRRWLNRPIRSPPLLRQRYHAIGALAESRRYEPLREQLRDIGDLERILARVALRSARPRDLVQLRASLAAAPTLRAELSRFDSPALGALQRLMGEHHAEQLLLQRAIASEPAQLLRDGGVIAPGYDAGLDELRLIASNTDGFLLELERRERERTGIRKPQARLQPRAGLSTSRCRVSRPRRVPAGVTCAADGQERRALHHPGTQGLRGQGAGRTRALAGAREGTLRMSC